MKVPATDTIIWQIDGEGTVLGFIHNNEVYYYLKNAQGDIVGIADKDSNVVANYTYDSWGKLVSIIDPSQDNLDVTSDINHIGYINPLRYRGYYYDSETSLYYLNARYYDPETGRFINSDDNLSGLNLYRYCANNPIYNSDITGLDHKLDKYINTNYKGKVNVAFAVNCPIPGSRKVIDQHVGHTFIRLDYGNGDVLYRGFYPHSNLEISQVLKKSDVNEDIINDKLHRWDIAKVYEITSESADKIKDFIDNYKEKYNLVKNNCTTFAVKALEAGGIKSPTSKHSWRLGKNFLGFLCKSFTLLAGYYGYTPPYDPYTDYLFYKCNTFCYRKN